MGTDHFRDNVASQGVGEVRIGIPSVIMDLADMFTAGRFQEEVQRGHDRPRKGKAIWRKFDKTEEPWDRRITLANSS